MKPERISFTPTVKDFMCFVIFSSFFLCVYFRERIFHSSDENKHSLLCHEEQRRRVMKHLLIWTKNSTYPFKLLQTGQKAFLDARCDVTDCYVTSDRSYLEDHTKFDAILFHGPELMETYRDNITTSRSFSQKFIFASVESADNYPICDTTYDGFFNWTWTFRLDSDIVWSPFAVRDIDSKIIAPKQTVEWLNNAKELNSEIKDIFRKRKRAVAWFVSNCETKSKRELYVEVLEMELRKHGLRVDVFGKCGLRRCPKRHQTMRDCENMLRRNYYFYLAFENSFSEDYVTEKILHGYSNYVVPIVFGSANYTRYVLARFLPPSSYLNALEIDAKSMADIIQRAIIQPEFYYTFFQWTSQYTIEASEDKADAHPFCKVCSALHDHDLMDQVTVYGEFGSWWNRPRDLCKSH